MRCRRPRALKPGWGWREYSQEEPSYPGHTPSLCPGAQSTPPQHRCPGVCWTVTSAERSRGGEVEARPPSPRAPASARRSLSWFCPPVLFQRPIFQW